MGMVQKQGNWVPYELKPGNIERRICTCELLLKRQNRKGFLHRIVTGDEKWIHYDNPKRRKSSVKPGHASTSTAKPNIHGKKLMLCIWWDQLGVIYYELLQPNEAITGERYQQQLMRLSRALKIKRPLYAKIHDKVIYQHDNARPHVAKVVKETLEALQWDVLPHPLYSPDIAPSDYHMFRSMTHGLAEQHFTSYEEARNWVNVWIASKDEEFFRHGIRMLPERWERVRGKSRECGAEQVLRSLHGLPTTDEKLKALCLKHTEMAEELKEAQAQQRGLMRSLQQVSREKEQLQGEHSRSLLARSRLESLCRELQRQNRDIKNYSKLLASKSLKKIAPSLTSQFTLMTTGLPDSVTGLITQMVPCFDIFFDGEVTVLAQPLCQLNTPLADCEDSINPVGSHEIKSALELQGPLARNQGLQMVLLSLPKLEESLARLREEEERRKELAAKFQTALQEMGTTVREQNGQLREENRELANRLKDLVAHYEAAEQHATRVVRQKEVEAQLHRAKFAKAGLELRQCQELHQRERQQLLATVAELQARSNTLSATEAQLRAELATYTDKYQDFQKCSGQEQLSLLQLQERHGLKLCYNSLTLIMLKWVMLHRELTRVFDQMTKKIKKLEKETTVWKAKWEKSNATLMDMAADAMLIMMGKKLVTAFTAKAPHVYTCEKQFDFCTYKWARAPKANHVCVSGCWPSSAWCKLYLNDQKTGHFRHPEKILKQVDKARIA
ncbi:hypothetical protein LAZ67_2006056 [Cordylochernes scorpioides]|uniref:Uncharacterized protein n=1 Tax=Cordylochernes scorpioides TaxID=51811 RepID=A0ABY6K899_9ARAC|nr:hypothetical protein LAZ67_2006056 [Cordylochernes scorpioides]